MVDGSPIHQRHAGRGNTFADQDDVVLGRQCVFPSYLNLSTQPSPRLTITIGIVLILAQLADPNDTIRATVRSPSNPDQIMIDFTAFVTPTICCPECMLKSLKAQTWEFKPIR